MSITEAKKTLGAVLKRVALGEEIGIVCGADIIALRKVEVRAVDWPVGNAVLREDAERARRDPLLDFTAFEGSGLGDLSQKHDEYLYDERK